MRVQEQFILCTIYRDVFIGKMGYKEKAVSPIIGYCIIPLDWEKKNTKIAVGS